MAMKSWVRLPSRWIHAEGLRAFRWEAGEGGNSIAALMLLIAIVHHIDEETGRARLTYPELEAKLGISRAKISAGLQLLEQNGLISRDGEGRSSIVVVDYDPQRGWAKLPARALYRGERIRALSDFNLRSKTELDALKLYLLFIALRDDATNFSAANYDTIKQYTGIGRAYIRRAISLLVTHNLINVEYNRRDTEKGGTYSVYRVTHIDSYRHMGTIGRQDDGAADLF